MYSKKKTNISFNEINKLTNLNKNSDIGELVDNCLANNIKRTNYLISENNFSSEDSIIIIRTFLSKTKRLLNLIDNFSVQKNLDKTIASAETSIFGKTRIL